MSRTRNRRVFLIFALLFYFFKSVGQQYSCCDREIKPFIEAFREAESGEMDYTDTLKKSIRLIFEKEFDDSIMVVLDDSIIYNSMIITNKPYAPRAKFIDVDYSMKKDTPYLVIKRADGKCIWFYLIPGHRVAYINYFKDPGVWMVELSNIHRQYI